MGGSEPCLVDFHPSLMVFGLVARSWVFCLVGAFLLVSGQEPATVDGVTIYPNGASLSLAPDGTRGVHTGNKLMRL